MSWSPLEIAALAAIGVIAGAINSIAGGGSLIAFPALVAFGVPPLTANVSNTIAQVPGYLAIVNGYRPELAGQRSRFLHLLPAALLGGGIGVALLKLGSEATFRIAAPALILLACVLLMFQPRLRAWVASGREGGHTHGVHFAVAGACAYASYFGAAAGVLLLAVLAIFLADTLQRLNALNRLLILVVNLLAAGLYAILGPVSWVAVVILGPSTVIGGHYGVGIVRRFSTETLRYSVITVGLAASAYLIAKYW